MKKEEKLKLSEVLIIIGITGVMIFVSSFLFIMGVYLVFIFDIHSILSGILFIFGGIFLTGIFLKCFEYEDLKV
jgi:hypothetical protein